MPVTLLLPTLPLNTLPLNAFRPFAVLDPAVHLAYLAVTQVAGALPWSGGSAIAAALVLVTVATRIGLLPLSVAAARADRAKLALAPQLARLRTRFGANPARLARELAAAHRRAGISPFAGLMPALAQFPVVSTMYRLVTVPLLAGQPNPVLTANLLGAQLGLHWPGIITAAGVLAPPTAFLAVLLLALCLLAAVSGRQAVARIRRAARASGAGDGGPSTAIARLLPFSAVAIAAAMPPAVGLYLVTATAWTVAERAVLDRLL